MFHLMEDGKTYAWWTELSGRIVAFIPSNDVLAKALQEGGIPGIEGSVGTDGVLNATVTDADALRTYLTNYISILNLLRRCPDVLILDRIRG